MNLVGSMLDFSSPSAEMAWITLFGMLLNGAITPERDGEYFVYCFDMLMMRVLGLYSGSALPTMNANGEVAKPRYHEYAVFVKAARKEIGDRPLSASLKCLEQLLPVTRGSTELAAFGDWFSATSLQKPSSVSKLPASGANFARNGKSIRMQKLAEPV
uniref:PI3K/PI4K domain-containing protein n=1 Tax=Panagrellus redivivus TaxID=6233 RepID=A0A7E4VG58_PANRE